MDSFRFFAAGSNDLETLHTEGSTEDLERFCSGSAGGNWGSWPVFDECSPLNKSSC